MNNPHLIPFFIFSTLLIIACTATVIFSVVIQKQRQFRNRLARQQMEFDYSQSLLHTRIEVQETTLNMLAQELHDNVTQMLTGCYMQITHAADYMEQEKGREIMETAKGSMKSLISDVRLLSHSLATGMVERRELQEAIQAELMRLQAFSNITCKLESTTIYELPPEQRLMVFRVVQEALQNVVKHAAATQIKISIDSEEDHYSVVITDNGRGFDSADTQSTKTSMGLMSMSDRIAMLKGSLDITSARGKGTTIKVSIPINEPGNGKDTDSTG